MQKFFRSGTFESAFDPRENSFGFLRLVFALMVLVSHSFTLGGYGPEPLLTFTKNRINLGAVGVECFFVLSGFLIVRSMIKSPSITSFMWNRCLRIMPAYWLCLIVTALGFVPVYCLAEGRDIAAFYRDHSAAVWSYIKADWLLQMNQYDIPPLLQTTPYKGAINGSLWSLIYEWRCYLLVAIFGLIVSTRAFRGVYLFFLALTCFSAYAHWSGMRGAWSHPGWFGELQMARLTPYFLVGGACFIFQKKIPNSAALFIASLLLFRWGLRHDWGAVVGPFSLSYAVLWMAFNLPKKLSLVDEIGDVSYGVYIYAFPIQQALSAFGLHTYGLTAYVLGTTFFTFVLAAISYHFVEKPALQWKRFDPTFGLEKVLRQRAAQVFKRGSVEAVK